MKKTKRISLAIVGIVFIINISILTTGCQKHETNEEKLVVTVNDANIYLDEMMYYILQLEAKGQETNEFYEAVYGEKYWDVNLENGMTYSEMLKQDVMDMAVDYEIFYNKAQENQYTLSESQIEMNKNNTKVFLASLNHRQKTIAGLTENEILKIQEKLALGKIYYDELIGNIDVDEQAIRKDIDYDPYRQFDIEYIYAPFVTKKEDGTISYYSKEKKEEVYNIITALEVKAHYGAKFGMIVRSDSDTVQLHQLSFLQGDGNLEENLEKEVTTLLTGEISDVIETKTGYYIVKMVLANSFESYEKVVEELVLKERKKNFIKALEKIKKEYNITINTQVWDMIDMGSTTISQENPMMIE